MKITINLLWLTVPAVIGLALLLLSDHRQHALDFLPFLILLVCPLMHLFGHGRHRHNPSGAP